MKTTLHFRDDVLRKRPELREEWIEAVLAKPEEKLLQTNGRISYYGYMDAFGKWLRVVTLEDGETVHTAYFDRNYRPKRH